MDQGQHRLAQQKFVFTASAALDVASDEIMESRTAMQTESLSNEQIERLHKVIRDSSTAAHPFEVASAVYRVLREPLDLGVYFNYLLLEGADTMWLSSYAGIPLEAAQEIQHLEFGHAVCGAVALTRSPITVQDVQNSPDQRAQLVRAFGVRAYSCNPLIADGRLIGTLSMGSLRRTRFGEPELALLRLAAEHVAQALGPLLPKPVRQDAPPRRFGRPPRPASAYGAPSSGDAEPTAT